MAKKKKDISAIKEQMDYRLRQWCGRIPPRRRIAIVLILLFLFAGLSLYITFSSLFSFGKDEREKLNFKHIEGLQLELKDERNKRVV
ncbi:MAG TPA: hypothetical protein DD458_03690 [Prolixibacteraceae bacterium]|nr:hypothetical protein [Prolixibacteraceae bacterium]HCU64081.1 hypothetical protein [Prolixibacteraceae bacterium]